MWKPPASPASRTSTRGSKTQTSGFQSRESSALLKFDMRLPARVKAELRTGKQGKAVREYIEKANIRPVLMKGGRHETLRTYFEALDKDKSGSLEFSEVKRWLPKVGMNNDNFKTAIANHFRFMDKDNSDEIDFKEFCESTIDAADQKLSCYADEQYAKQFGMEIYMFLALCTRNKALKQFERDEAKAYEPGNELVPFFQFERLMQSSQAVFMPYELYAPEDDRVAGQRRESRPNSAAQRSEAHRSANAISTAARSVLSEYSSNAGPGGSGALETKESSVGLQSSVFSSSLETRESSSHQGNDFEKDTLSQTSPNRASLESEVEKVQTRNGDSLFSQSQDDGVGNDNEKDNESDTLTFPNHIKAPTLEIAAPRETSASGILKQSNATKLDSNEGETRTQEGEQGMKERESRGGVWNNSIEEGLDNVSLISGPNSPKSSKSVRILDGDEAGTGDVNNGSGYKQLWGLAPEEVEGLHPESLVAEIEAGIMENRRVWANRRREEIVNKVSKKRNNNLSNRASSSSLSIGSNSRGRAVDGEGGNVSNSNSITRFAPLSPVKSSAELDRMVGHRNVMGGTTYKLTKKSERINAKLPNINRK